MYQKIKINGLDFIHSFFPGFETASLGIFLKTGSRFEKKHQKGIAHFLEHMLFKGSRAYSYKKIKREIEGKGGLLNGFTSKEITAYYACFLNKNTLKVLDILLDMVLNPLLFSKEIEKERSVILEEIKMYNDLPSARAKTILDSLLWQNHSLGDDIAGYQQTIKKIKRKDFFDFKNNFYLPSNMVISFCGNFSLDKIKNFINDKTKKIKKTKKTYSFKPKSSTGVKIKTEKKDTQQLHFCAGFQSIAYRSDERITQQILHVILGANMSSRLFESLREKKSLCYDVSTQVKEFRDSGAFALSLGLDKRRLDLALAIIKKELVKITEKKVKKSELSRAKDYFLGQLLMSLENPQGRMFYLAQSHIKAAKIENLVRVKDLVKEVSPCRLRDFSSRLFNFRNICVAAVGNVDAGLEERIKKLL